MSYCIIDVTLATKTAKEEIENKLYWYDPVDKYMHVFKGGKLNYEYIEFPDVEVLVPGMGWISGKTIAYPEKVTKNAYKTENNAKEIVAWVEENKEILNLNLLSVTSSEVTIMFPTDKRGETKWKDALESGLYSKRFRYEIINA